MYVQKRAVLSPQPTQRMYRLDDTGTLRPSTSHARREGDDAHGTRLDFGEAAGARGGGCLIVPSAVSISVAVVSVGKDNVIVRNVRETTFRGKAVLREADGAGS